MANLSGGDGNDTLTGTRATDVLSGLGGDDEIVDHLGGDDQLFGGAGNDDVEVDRDFLSNSGLSIVLLDGGAGNDTIRAYSSRSDAPFEATLLGGSGDDWIIAGGYVHSVIDAGDGNDLVNLLSIGPQTITLGAGRDHVALLTFNYTLPSAPDVITDFTTGAGGDIIDMSDLLPSLLHGWDGKKNPFAEGYLRFAQGAGATLLQVDVEGKAANWVTLIQLNNVLVTSITDDNFEKFSPSGNPPAGRVIDGTDKDDELVDGLGNDTFHGFGGHDFINAQGGGADWVYGGSGNDELFGSEGDHLFGEAGDDRITVAGLPSPDLGPAFADGGDGFDLLEITVSSGQNAKVSGGSGDDTFTVNGPGSVVLHGDAGHDTMTLTGSDGAQTLFLGSDSDVVMLEATQGAPVLDIRDFQAGPGGDRLSIVDFLMAKLPSWQTGQNPFSNGLLRLIDTAAGAQLQYRDGNVWTTVAVLEGVAAASLVTENLAGLDPSGGPLRNVIVVEDYALATEGTPIADVMFGGIGDDTLRGGAGDDLLLGGSGFNHLFGGDGNDTLFGGLDGYIKNNSLAGGAGADTFLVAPGIGTLLIADFQPGVDHIEVHGIAGTPTFSPNYSGTATLIDFGSGDSVTLLGVTQLLPGDIQYVAGNLVLPSAPQVGAQPIMASNLTIPAAGMEFIGKFNPITITEAVTGTSSFDNYGVLSATAPQYLKIMQVYGVAADLNFPGTDLIWNHSGATIFGRAIGPTGIVNVSTLRNDGLIHLVGYSSGYAWGPEFGTIGLARVSHVDNSGVIRVEAKNPAIAIRETVEVNNSGVIHAETESQGATAILLYGGAGSRKVVNTGLIEAVNTNAFANIGADSIGIAVGGTGSTVSDIQNSGTIRADFAIFSGAGSENVANAGQIIGKIDIGQGYDSIVNSASGSISGAIDTGSEDDTVVNQGIISGDVSLGAGNDSYDGSSGQLFGVVSGDDGNDVLKTGLGNDTLHGGLGNDTLEGGAGLDLATYDGTRGSATVSRNATSHALTVSTTLDGTDTVRHVEQFRFADRLYSFTFAGAGAPVVANFNPAFGWASQDQYPRHVADVNGDGYADIVGFGTAGVLVSFGSAGGSFTGAAVKLADFGQNAGWATDNGFHRELADVNGDGRADILGFGFAGTLVGLAKADGTFGTVSTGITDFGVNQGWANQNGFARTVGDVNGDGKADLVGFGFAGALVALGNGNGTFQPVKTAIANFGVNQGWTSDNTFHRAVADVNGDGKADIIGFGFAGTYVALAKGDGTFADAQLVLNDFGTSQGWASNDSFSRLVADVNGDHIADIVGFGIAGTLVAFGKGDGTFTQASLDVGDFGKNQGWSSDNTFHREVADVNKDGLADVVGFGIAGVLIGANQGDFLV